MIKFARDFLQGNFSKQVIFKSCNAISSIKTFFQVFEKQTYLFKKMILIFSSLDAIPVCNTVHKAAQMKGESYLGTS